MSTRREFLTQSAVAALLTTAAAPLSSVESREAQGAAPPAGGAAGAMKTCRIPHTDLVVSRLAYGNARRFFGVE